MLIGFGETMVYDEGKDMYVEVRTLRTAGCGCCSDDLHLDETRKIKEHLRQMYSFMSKALVEAGLDWEDIR